MGSYDIMQVCLNGHQITDSYQTFVAGRQAFCKGCGEKTIIKCLNCNQPIRGRYHADGVINCLSTHVSDFCHSCGEPYPWAGRNDEDEGENPLGKLEHIFKRFHKVARQLRARHDNRPTLTITDEYDVQDLLHAILKLFFTDIRPEEWTPSYAGASARMDFLLKNEEIAVEVKKTRESLKAKTLGEQLIVDITKYKEHPHCETLICFVYDPEGIIGNPEGLKSDLEKMTSDDLEVIVLIFPE